MSDNVKLGAARTLNRVSQLVSPPRHTSESGSRAKPEDALRHMYDSMWVDPTQVAAIHDIRNMDRCDGRVKKIHVRMARTATKGGLILKLQGTDRRISRLAEDFIRRNNLHRRSKLESDARAIAMEGNLPLQVALDATKQVAALIRMPTETIRPVVTQHGTFKDINKAYEQVDVLNGKVSASFALWQLIVERLTPDNFDDMGCMGRPYLDSSREVWKKLCMTETDLVIKRRHRAPARTAHVVEGATETELELYKQRIEGDQTRITSNYYMNKKGSVTAVQGDANLDQIADVNYLLDTFYAGGPAPKGLFGYVEGLNRDILEDLKQDYFDEIDAMQDIHANAYEQAFRFDLLLRGINPNNIEFNIAFKERKTETPNQAADRALKVSSLGASRQTSWEIAQLDPTLELVRRKEEQKSKEAYPEDDEGDDLDKPKDRVTIIPGNAKKKESATSIKNQ
jgi:hypothetical protein